MRSRMLRIGVLAAVLFAVNLAGRLVVRIGSIEDPDGQQLVTLAAYAVIAVAMAVAAVLWARQRPTGPVLADLAGGVVIAGVLILAVGPFVSGTTPAQIGAGDTFNAGWQYVGFAAGGALLGLMVLITLGKDYTSRALQQFAAAKLVKPPRAIRR